MSATARFGLEIFPTFGAVCHFLVLGSNQRGAGARMQQEVFFSFFLVFYFSHFFSFFFSLFSIFYFSLFIFHFSLSVFFVIVIFFGWMRFLPGPSELGLVLS